MSKSNYKENESNIEFLHTFHVMRVEINKLMMRDFGIKPRSYNVKLVEEIYRITDSDKLTLEEMLNKYGMNNIGIEKYPQWLIDSWRTEIRWLMKHLSTEIELANSVYITNESEYIERRGHWNLAIGYCNALKDSFHEIFDTVKVSVGCYEVIGKLLYKEINLLKGVRKSDNKVIKILSDKKGNN